ncbi:hypothetical protein BV25DRAFT_1837152 [Artomyces pyxidatus]|uniref:Uncharacterized protein n=1 Tax=Artomyces pyxidatus TaxID=48021 RepID=A0ACB8T521_9AGAM|nr:hypothetical protein BV25DRAFT_1837152 [Artomyces pyxidatus]
MPESSATEILAAIDRYSPDLPHMAAGSERLKEVFALLRVTDVSGVIVASRSFLEFAERLKEGKWFFGPDELGFALSQLRSTCAVVLRPDSEQAVSSGSPEPVKALASAANGTVERARRPRSDTLPSNTIPSTPSTSTRPPNVRVHQFKILLLIRTYQVKSMARIGTNSSAAPPATPLPYTSNAGGQQTYLSTSYMVTHYSQFRSAARMPFPGGGPTVNARYEPGAAPPPS